MLCSCAWALGRSWRATDMAPLSVCFKELGRAGQAGVLLLQAV